MYHERLPKDIIKIIVRKVVEKNPETYISFRGVCSWLRDYKIVKNVYEAKKILLNGSINQFVMDQFKNNIEIVRSGKYSLISDIEGFILINSDNVVLDLNRFTISGHGPAIKGNNLIRIKICNME